MKQPLALLINDIHVSKDNIPEFKKNWEEALTICQEEDIKEIIIGGDLFTTRANQTLSVLLAVKQAFADAQSKDIVVTVAKGNHDSVDLEAYEGYAHIFKGLKGINIIEAYEILTWGEVNFALIVMSYFPENGSFLQKLDNAVEEAFREFNDIVKTKEDIILYIHEGIHGALGDFEIPGVLPQEPFLDFKKVLCGHYHNRVRIKNTPIEYIGSSRQHSFGEDEFKGYTILYSDGSYKFIQNEVNTRYATYEIMANDLEELELNENPLYKYKIKVSCDEKQAKLINKQKLLDMGFDKVEVLSETPINKETATSGISEKYDKAGICKEYLSYCEQNSINSKLGIKYLEG